ncbi:MAG: HipA N-terminal domain-containing protein [Gemmatimonadetes bacterium]|nr:HipA N-terminal domain-containing protein [Gemmatimonadota bacterium]
MGSEHLEVVLDGSRLGRVERRSDGRLRFVYEDSSRMAAAAIPLSISMPLSAAEHGHEHIEPFLDGLLPDSEEVRRSWGRDFQVSHRNPYSLLEYVGEDCAGAAQFVRPDRLEQILSEQRWEVDWLTIAEVAARLRKLDQNAACSGGRRPRDGALGSGRTDADPAGAPGGSLPSLGDPTREEVWLSCTFSGSLRNGMRRETPI